MSTRSALPTLPAIEDDREISAVRLIAIEEDGYLHPDDVHLEDDETPPAAAPQRAQNNVIAFVRPVQLGSLRPSIAPEVFVAARRAREIEREKRRAESRMRMVVGAIWATAFMLASGFGWVVVTH